MADSNAVTVRGLRVTRGGRTVLDDIDLEVGSGRLVGLLGPSGSGKTTLMRALVGVQRYAAGRVEILGSPAGAASLRRRVAYTTQSPAVYADLTVAENLGYMSRVLGVSSDAVEREIGAVGLVEERDRVVGRLSGGQQTRVSLAMALLGGAELLILDEPTVGLDPLLRRDLWQRFTGMAKRATTMLISSHVLDEAERCDDIVLLREGRVLAAGTPQELKRRTRTESVEAAFIALVGDGEVAA